MMPNSGKTLVLMFSCVQSASNCFKIFSIYAKQSVVLALL